MNWHEAITAGSWTTFASVNTFYLSSAGFFANLFALRVQIALLMVPLSNTLPDMPQDVGVFGLPHTTNCFSISVLSFMALLEDYSTTTSKREVLSILEKHGGSMDARELIESVHSQGGIDREAVRRAILRLTADNQTAYTSDWKVIIVDHQRR